MTTGFRLWCYVPIVAQPLSSFVWITAANRMVAFYADNGFIMWEIPTTLMEVLIIRFLMEDYHSPF